MFLMWIVPLLLIGLTVYVISGNNFTNALNPVASRTCPSLWSGGTERLEKLPALRTDFIKGKQNEKE